MKKLKSSIMISLSSLLVITGVSLLLFTVFPDSFQLNGMFGQTSIISSAKTVSRSAQHVAKQIPASQSCDLGIRNVVIREDDTRSGTFYYADITLHNNGENLTKADVNVIINETQTAKASNIGGSLSLFANKDYVLRDVKLDFDTEYNGLDLDFELSVENIIDTNYKNDTYSAQILNKKSKIKDIHVNNLVEDEKIGLTFNNANFPASFNTYEFFVAKNIKFNENTSSYHEFSDIYDVFEYTVIPNTKDYISSFTSLPVTENEAHFLDFDKSMLQNADNYALFIKTTNIQTNEYAFSDVLLFRTAKEITRTDFVKFMVDELNINLPTIHLKEDTIFVDLDASTEEYSYVKALYDLGLLDIKLNTFFPDHYLTRGDAIQIVLDYFDVNLTTSDQIDINDVMYKSPSYYYGATLLETDKNNTFSKYLHLEDPATINFVNYLINEYPQNI